jgi:hypothetical protein
MKTVLVSIACVFLAVTLLWAGNGDFIVDGNLGVGTTGPAYPLDVYGIIGINGNQMVYLPDQTQFTGSLIVGNGGGSLAHGSGYDGQLNTFVGIGAGTSNTTGSTNFAVGSYALQSNTTGNQNLALGAGALRANTNGYNNTAIGTSGLFYNNGSYNTAIGTNTLFSASGWDNLAVGYGAGYNPAFQLTSLSQTVFMGSGATAAANGLSNAVAIGYNTQATQSNQVTLGNSSITQTLLNGNVAIGTSNLGSGGSNALLLADGAKPTGLSGTAGLYAAVGTNNVTELFGFDGMGNVKQLTSHACDAPDWMYDTQDGLPMIVREVQLFLGYVRYTNETRQARLIGMTDAEKQGFPASQRTCVFQETFADHEARTGEALTVLVWEDGQAAVKQQMDAARQSLLNTRAGLAAIIAQKTNEAAAARGQSKLDIQSDLSELQQHLNALVIPDSYVIKPIPARLQAALGNSPGN